MPKQPIPPILQLLRGDVVLGTIAVNPLDTNPPWHSGAFAPTAAFGDVRDLFEHELRLLRANESDDPAQWEDWEAAHAELHDPGLRLASEDASFVDDEILIHIDGSEAWWRGA